MEHSNTVYSLCSTVYQWFCDKYYLKECMFHFELEKIRNSFNTVPYHKPNYFKKVWHVGKWLMKMSRELKLALFSNLFPTVIGHWLHHLNFRQLLAAARALAEQLVYSARVDVCERDILKPKDKLLLGNKPNHGLSHVAWINQRALWIWALAYLSTYARYRIFHRLLTCVLIKTE